MPKVLIVDDSLTDRALIKAITSKWMGSTVEEASDGLVALEKIAASQPDLVLTDLHMPNMDGLELVEAIRHEFPTIPVILMTALGSEEVAAQSLQAGAASYVPKRRLAEDLVNTIEQVYRISLGQQNRDNLMHYMQQTDTEFVLPNNLNLIRQVVDQVLNMLRCLPLEDETERLRVGIALREALENACFHGNLEVRSVSESSKEFEEIATRHARQLPYRDRRIHFRTEINRVKATFIISDEGSGFDAAEFAEKKLSADSDQRGRGVFLMRSTMDDVQYSNNGKTVTLVKNCYQPATFIEGSEESGD